MYVKFKALNTNNMEEIQLRITECNYINQF
jgi:hypothetical protein